MKLTVPRLNGFDRRHMLGAIAAAPLAISVTPAQGCDEAMAKDWPNLSRYAADNAIRIANNRSSDIVFMGDSITQGWPDKRPTFFGEGRVCRGIGGQTTPQMVLRMMADVIALAPKAVHIMAGTNDIAGNTGPMTAGQTMANIAAMATLAKAHNIIVLIGSIPPAANFPWRPGLETAKAIVSLNAQLLTLSKAQQCYYVDYTFALATPDGAMKPGLAYDGVHPDIAGYAAMEDVLLPYLARIDL